MNRLKGIKLKYTSPASPLKPYKIYVNRVYVVDVVNEKLYIYDGYIKQEMSLELLKILFTPVDKTWDEVLREEKEKLIKKQIKEIEE
jgi:hypothetical protein